MKFTLKTLLVATGLTLASSFSYAIPLKPVDTDYTLQLLGSGGPITDDVRASSGEVIWWKGKSKILIDAGAGVYLRFGQSGSRMEELDFLGVTHFHTDHVTDLPALLKGGYFFNRSSTLAIAGPTGEGAFPSLTKYMDAQFNHDSGAYAYLNGIYDGSDGLFPVSIQDVDFHKKTGTKVYEDDGLTIYAKGIPHGDVPTLAYRIESDKGIMVVSADQNGTDESFLDFAKGADLLVMPMAIDENADAISSFMHGTPSAIGKIAQTINPKALVLNHWMGKGLVLKDESIEIVKKYYKGPIYAGRDLSSYPMSAIMEQSNEQ
ncbi:MBL fold metallo-hydrolase [Photobacterium sp. BZF1]|uniref:MBL fold metallo-hydrolase n=1 Tax=Photobacterium sp. BZF1 TaxID=1904457 RepID=UPI00165377B4|nr:MBL fold metallo-hydrolase [Photobacterium sp. BZF1]MBC7002102.1 MBL fold metallo-hydrolase [Photobacterium sp. BZF1]